MSVRDTHARLATPGECAIIPTNSGQPVCLGSIDDADYIIQMKCCCKKGVTDAISLSFCILNICGDFRDFATIQYGSRPNALLVGDMANYDLLQMSMRHITEDLKHIGKVTAVLLEPMDDPIVEPAAFLARALALNNNLLFGCEHIQLVDRALMYVDMHNAYKVWIVTSTPQSRTISLPLVLQNAVGDVARC